MADREISTQRLRLRPHTLDDFPACTALWGDPLVTRFIGGKPSNHEEVWARMLRYMGHWTALGYGYWAVVEKESNHLIGEVGLSDFKRDIVPAIEPPEVGWAFAPSAQGKGYAMEAVQAALAWGEARLSAQRMMCMISSENERSIRLAVRCGFREFARTMYKDAPTCLFERRAIAGV